MTSRIDLKRAALELHGLSGAIPEMTLEWLQIYGASSDQLTDAWYEVLLIQGYTGQRNDMWFELLGDRGYVGALPDRETAFWGDGGSLAPPMPLADWTIGQLGDLYGFGPGYGSLVPNTNGDVSVLRLDVDSSNDLVTVSFDFAPTWNPILIAAIDFEVATYAERTGDPLVYEITDAVFTAAIVAELGNTTPARLLPGGVVQVPRWETNIPDGVTPEGVPFIYDVSQHIAANPFFAVLDYALQFPVIGADVDSDGIFTVDEFQPAGVQTFSIFATNVIGQSAPSNSFEVTIQTDPVIDVEPQDLEVTFPDGGLFEVVASHPAGADLFYEWSIAPPLNTGPTNLATLSVLSTVLQDDGATVECRVSAYSADSIYFVDTVVASLTVNDIERFDPVIDVQPADLVVDQPDGGVVFVSASHPDEENGVLFYQWIVWDGDDALDPVDVLDTNDSTLTNLTLNSTDIAHNGYLLICVVRAYDPEDPTYQVVSDPAELIISLPQVPPVIDEQPESSTVTEPDPTSFTVVASHPNDADLFYAWQCRNLADDAWIAANAVGGLSDVTGAFDPTMIVNTTEIDDTRAIRCRIRAYDGGSPDFQVISNTVQLTVLGEIFDPVIDTQPEPLVVIVPDGGSFTVVASHPDGADLFYLWQVRGLNDPGAWYAASNPSEGLSDVTDDHLATMLVNSTILTDNRDVRVTVYAYVDQGDVFVISDEVYLEVVEDTFSPVWGIVDNLLFDPAANPHLVDMNDFILQGDDLENWALINNPAGITIDGAGIATINTVVGGIYPMQCFVENLFGDDTSVEFTWAVAGPPVIDTQPQPLVVIEPSGGQFTIDVSHVDPNAPLFYFWTHTFSDASGETTDTLTLGSTVQADDALTTQCRVRAYIDDGTFEVNSDVVALTVNRVSATIDQQPDDATVVEGLNTSFEIEASHVSGAPLFYQWLHTLSTPVSGETSNTLQLTGALIGDDGETVSCRVRAYQDTAANEVTSNLATLTVELALQAPDWSTIPDQVDVDTDLPQTLDMDNFCDDADFYTNQGDGDLVGSILTIPAETRPDPILNCQVAATNVVGTETSNEFTWEITGVDPVITTQPVPLVVTEPQGGTFTVAATHPTNAPLAYRWEANDGGGWLLASDVLSDVAGGTSGTTLTLGSTVQADASADVRCRVRAYTGTAGTYQVFTNEVGITVNRVPPVINTQPTDSTVGEGEDSGFLVSASHPAGAPLFYQWTHDYAEVSGGFTANLQILNAAISDDGKAATCEVFAYEGGTGPSVVSDPATLTVTPAAVAPSWDTIANQTSGVLDLPDPFDSTAFLDDGGGQIRSFGTDGPTTVDGQGNVGLPRRPVGLVQNNVVRATNDVGEAASDPYNWLVQASDVIDDDFSYTLGQPLAGNGPWVDTPGASNTVVASGIINGPAQITTDLTDFLPGGDEFEFEVTLNGTPQGIVLIDILTVAMTPSINPNDEDGLSIRIAPSLTTFTTPTAVREWNASNSNNQTFGMKRLANGNVECYRGGNLIDTISGAASYGPLRMMFATVPLNETENIGFQNATYTVLA